MIDVEKLKAQLDLRQIVERDLGKPRFRGRDYTAFKCPLHSEHKGYSLVVYAHHWRCFGKCHASGDAITWVQHYHQLTFHEACERLTNGDLPQIESVNTARRTPEPIAQPPDAAWQAKARRIITEGEFHALIAWQVCGDSARAAAIGSASHARIDRRWYGKLLGVPRVIACMNADAAGEGAAAQLAALSNAVRCVQVPCGKDLNEFYQQADENTVKEWLQTVINR